MDNLFEKGLLGVAGIALAANAIVSAIPVTPGASRDIVLAAYNAGATGEKIAFYTPSQANVPLALVNGLVGAGCVFAALNGVNWGEKDGKSNKPQRHQPQPIAMPKTAVNNIVDDEHGSDELDLSKSSDDDGLSDDVTDNLTDRLVDDVTDSLSDDAVNEPKPVPLRLNTQVPKASDTSWDLAVATKRLKLTMPKAPVFDWDEVYGQTQGFMITGNSGAGKSCVATWLLGWLTKKEPSVIFVLDHHGSQSWKFGGIDMSEVVSDFDMIMQLVDALDKELDSRKKLFKKGLPVGENIIVLIDEFTSLLLNLKKNKIDPTPVQMLIRSLLIEGRKFGMTVIVITHNVNCSEFEMSAAERNSFGMIKLCGYAKPELDNLKIRNDHIAYPCFVGGTLPASIAVHPTHGWSNKFEKIGVPPKGILPIQRAELPEDSMLSIMADLIKDLA
jgi:hypothetical protein